MQSFGGLSLGQYGGRRGGGGSLGATGYYVATYASDGDANGIIYFIGADFNPAGTFVNPILKSGIGVQRKGTTEAGTVVDYTDRVSNSTHADNVAGNWVALDLGLNCSALVNKYSLRARPAGDRAMRNWKLQGTNIAVNNSLTELGSSIWTDLDVRSGDTTMAASASAWGTYTVTGVTTAYRRFRILSTGLNSSADNYLIFGEIEFYGLFSYAS